MITNNIKPTDSELEILQILWETGAATVKTVNEILNQQKETGYTTTLKLMQIMFEKGLLERMANGRSHIYSPVYKKDDTRSVLVDKLMNTAFGGSAANLVLHALGNSKTTKSEIDQIKDLIKKIEETENGTNN